MKLCYYLIKIKLWWTVETSSKADSHCCRVEHIPWHHSHHQYLVLSRGRGPAGTCADTDWRGQRRGQFCAVLPATIDGGAAAPRPQRRWTDNDERGSRRTAIAHLRCAVRGPSPDAHRGPAAWCFAFRLPRSCGQSSAITHAHGKPEHDSLLLQIDREGVMNGHREGSRVRGNLWLERMEASNVIAKPRV